MIVGSLAIWVTTINITCTPTYASRTIHLTYHRSPCSSTLLHGSSSIVSQLVRYVIIYSTQRSKSVYLPALCMMTSMQSPSTAFLLKCRASNGRGRWSPRLPEAARHVLHGCQSAGLPGTSYRDPRLIPVFYSDLFDVRLRIPCMAFLKSYSTNRPSSLPCLRASIQAARSKADRTTTQSSLVESPRTR